MIDVVYVSDLGDIADYFDIAYLLLSPRFSVTLVIPEAQQDSVAALRQLLPSKKCTTLFDVESVKGEGATWIVTADYAMASRILDWKTNDIRSKVSRLFLVGGQINNYGASEQDFRFSPRLRQSNPEFFQSSGDPRVLDSAALNRLLVSGESIIWLPRDVCLWRYSAAEIFALGPNPVNQWLLRRHVEYTGQNKPVLLSSLPAFCLSVSPDTMPWLRLFQTSMARLSVTGNGGSVHTDLTTADPNAYVVTAIDGFACGKLITDVLRGATE